MFEEHKKKLACYVAVNFKYGALMAQQAMEKMTAPDIEEPADLDPNASEMEKIKWKSKWDQYVLDKKAWEDAGAKAYNLVLQHCHPTMEIRLEALPEWENIVRDQDIVGLLSAILKVVHKHDEIKGGVMQYVEQDLQLFLGFQQKGESLTDYHTMFNMRCDIVDRLGGRAGYHPKLYREQLVKVCNANGTTPASATQAERDQAMKTACDEYKGCLFLQIASEDQYGALKKSLDNQNLFGTDAYPKTVDDALTKMQNFKAENQKQPANPRMDADGVAFAQPGNQEKEPYNKFKFKKCHGCGETGHIVYSCPKLSEEEKAAVRDRVKKAVANVSIGGDEADAQECVEGVAHLNVDGNDDASIATCDSIIDTVGLIQTSTTSGGKYICNPHYLYLDSAATQHSMAAVEYLSRRHTTKSALRQHCNAGTKMTNRVGYWNGLRFWENPDGIANLLSLPQLELDGYDIYKNKDEWYAISPNGGRIDFKLDSGVCRRMAYIDLRAPEEHFFDDGLAMVQTVRGNYEGFTKAQVVRAREARRATAMMAHPTDERLKHVVSNTNVVPNCTFNATDLTNARAIYGPDRGGLRGKTVRKRPEPVRPEFITIPQDLYEKVVNVTLTADVMFVNGLPFLITQSRGIRLLTIEFLPSSTAEQLSKSLLKIARLYRRGGFMIRTCLMDMEFECLQEAIDYLLINCTAAREHVTDIERSIRTVKERSRSVVSELPYADCMPDQMVIHLMYFVCMWINAFPSENGVSTQYSPREIVTGTKMDYSKHCKALWGSYVEASKDADITNTLKQRTYPCIVLGPTGNFQGSVKCFNLETKQVIKRRTVAR
jgi:hypothetical protein